MNTRTKLEVKNQRPKRYIRRDAETMSVDRTAGLRWGPTHAESEKEKQRYGMGAQAPVQVALL